MRAKLLGLYGIGRDDGNFDALATFALWNVGDHAPMTYDDEQPIVSANGWEEGYYWQPIGDDGVPSDQKFGPFETADEACEDATDSYRRYVQATSAMARVAALMGGAEMRLNLDDDKDDDGPVDPSKLN